MYRKGTINPELYSVFVNAPSEMFEYSMSNIMDNVFSNLMVDATDGTFKCVCLSGFVSDNNTGTGIDPLDGFKDPQNNGFYLILRPLGKIGDLLPDPRDFKTKREIYDIISLHSSVFLARADYGYSNTEAIKFGQVLNCYFEDGAISTSDFRNLVFQDPDGKVVYHQGFRKLTLNTNASSTVAQNFDNGTPVLLGSASPISEDDILASSEENDIKEDWQIPGAILPISADIPSRITSVMGARPTKPGTIQVSHSGVDIGQKSGSPLYAIFDGKVLAARASGKNRFTASDINKQVGSTGYGMVVVTQHTTKNNAGQDVTFTLEYGHIYDTAVKKGDTIRQGQVIAYVGNRGGSTGAHLHLTMRSGPGAFSGAKQSALAMFGWYNRLVWKSTELKQKWANSWPDLAG